MLILRRKGVFLAQIYCYALLSHSSSSTRKLCINWGLIVLCLAVIFSFSWHNDADDSGEASLFVNGVRAIHIDVDCVDGALQMGSQVDACEKPCGYHDH